MTPEELTRRLKALATELGFSLAGVAPAVRAPGADRLDEWLESGYAGQMGYMADRRDAYDHPSGVLDGAKSVLMLTLDYLTEEPKPPEPGAARVSRYAWGDADYHDLIRPKLHQLADTLREWSPGATARGVVDTAPLMERDFAQLAGLGWVGKNTLLLNRERGSYFFLAALVTDAELVVDQPAEADHCGTCTACLDACPTDAFPAPRVLDASRCLSYLTIELKDLPPDDLRPHMGEWLFGCDVCQEVCPWNRFAKPANESRFQPRDDSNPIDLIELLGLDEAGFRARFRDTPLWRPRRRGLLRNAALALGAQKTSNGLKALSRSIHDEEPLVRAASAWALGQYGYQEAEAVLETRHQLEEDSIVIEEINSARSKIAGSLGDREP